MDDLKHLILEVFLIMGAFVLGGLLASWDHGRRRVPPPDSKAQRGYPREY